MLNDASGFQKIYLATGYTDLRRGMEGLANIIRFRRWFPVIVQTVRYRCFQLVKEQRRSTGNYSGTVRDAHAGTGDCCQTPDRADRGSEETLLSFVHFAEIFCGQFYLAGLAVRCLFTMILFCHPCGWEGRAIVDNSTENLKGSSDCSGFQYCSTVIMTKGKQPPAGGNVAYLL